MTDKKLETAALRVNELAADRRKSSDNFSRRSIVRALALGGITVTGGFSALRTLTADGGAIVPNALNLALKPALAQTHQRGLVLFYEDSEPTVVPGVADQRLLLVLRVEGDDELTGIFDYNERSNSPKDFYWDLGRLGHVGRNPGPYTEGQNGWTNPERALFENQQPHGFSDTALPRVHLFGGVRVTEVPDFFVFPVVGGDGQNFMRGMLIANVRDLTDFQFHPIGPSLVEGEELYVAYTDDGKYQTQLIGTMAMTWSGFNGVKSSATAFGDDFVNYADFSSILPALQRDISDAVTTSVAPTTTVDGTTLTGGTTTVGGTTLTGGTTLAGGTTLTGGTTLAGATTLGALPGDVMSSHNVHLKRQMEKVIEGTRVRMRIFRSRNRTMRDF